ncbi:MAG: tetratricopeptide repeat protein [Candidatus Hodarchaeales archaeon]|jgi:tetratricopeptide (TPR) repeat protein
MPISILEEIYQISKKFEEEDNKFLQAVEGIQKRGNLSFREEFECEKTKGRIYLATGSFGEATRISERLYKEGKQKNLPLFAIDGLTLKFFIKWILGQLEYGKLWEIVEESEDLLREASQEQIEDKERRNAFIDFEKSAIYRNIGDIDLSLEYCIKTLEAINKDKHLDYMLSSVLIEFGKIYYVKGELKKAENYVLQGIPLIKSNNLSAKVAKIYALWDLGENYRSQGRADKAIQSYEQALRICEDIKIPIYTRVVYTSLIEVYIDKKDIDDAYKYLDLFREYNSQYPGDDFLYQISKARVLKATGRIKNLAEAEKMFRTWMGDGFGPGWDLNYAASILIDLCQILITELQITDDPDIFEELESLVLQLLDIAEKQHSYTTLTSAKLIQGKLALIQLNTDDARKVLKEAQEIADEHGLQKLALSVSREHDKILGQLDIWEDLNKTKTPISERLKLASMDETIEYLKMKRSLESREDTSEEPMMLLIISEGGIMTFSYPFEDKWKFDEEIFGSFLTAFNTFSDEFFSKGLDRAKFGEEMILMQSVDTFLICYLYKGETYFALKKLDQFTEGIKENAEILQSLNKFSQTNQVLEIKHAPLLENLISKIFIHSKGK